MVHVDPWVCPDCGGEADNGFDRCIPPNPYLCKKCMKKFDKYDGLSCLDAALERKAMDEGAVTKPIFPENKAYKSSTYEALGLIPDKNVSVVVDKMISRCNVGLKKYGVTTERKDIDFNGWLTHLQEELMDACIYIERIKDDLKQVTKSTTL